MQCSTCKEEKYISLIYVNNYPVCDDCITIIITERIQVLTRSGWFGWNVKFVKGLDIWLICLVINVKG